MSHNDQHIIPRCYLKSWCDPETPERHEPYIWRFSKDGSVVQKKAPQNIFSENNFYTIKSPNGSRDLTLEHGLSELETKFTDIRRKKIRYQKKLNDEEKFLLSAFVAAMHGRTKSFVKHHQKQWMDVKGRLERLKKWVESATHTQRNIFAGIPDTSNKENRLTYEEITYITQNTVQVMLPMVVQTEAPIYFEMDHSILETDELPGFITSDNPCVWFDPDSHRRPPLIQQPGLMYPKIEVSLPLSPYQLLLINRQGLSGYMPASKQVVNEMNRRTRFYSSEYFVVSKNIKDDFWFYKGEEPVDSWNNVHGKS